MRDFSACSHRPKATRGLGTTMSSRELIVLVLLWETPSRQETRRWYKISRWLKRKSSGMFKIRVTVRQATSVLPTRTARHSKPPYQHQPIDPEMDWLIVSSTWLNCSPEPTVFDAITYAGEANKTVPSMLPVGANWKMSPSSPTLELGSFMTILFATPTQ